MGVPLALPLYRLVTRAFPFALTSAARRAHKAQAADPARIGERMGEAAVPRPQGPLIWLHAASVGEVQAVAALAPDLAARATLLVTTTTATGAERVAAALPPGTLHQFQPIDTPRAVSRFLDHWRPDLALFVESDMPPNTVLALSARGTPMALVGARPSRTRTRLPASMSALLRHFSLITAASEPVAQELRALGLSVAATEDLKSSAATAPAPTGWQNLTRPAWLAASTHPEDHAIVFAAHAQLLQSHPDALLVIAPRHPAEAMPQVPEGMTNARFDADAPPPDVAVITVDLMGTLPALHAAIPTAYIGGALAARGGHSPWEAALARSHVITGPGTASNAAAYAAVPHVTVQTADELAAAVRTAWAAPRPDRPPAGRSGAILAALEPLLAALR